MFNYLLKMTFAEIPFKSTVHPDLWFIRVWCPNDSHQLPCRFIKDLVPHYPLDSTLALASNNLFCLEDAKLLALTQTLAFSNFCNS